MIFNTVIAGSGGDDWTDVSDHFQYLGSDPCDINAVANGNVCLFSAYLENGLEEQASIMVNNMQGVYPIPDLGDPVLGVYIPDDGYSLVYDVLFYGDRIETETVGTSGTDAMVTGAWFVA